MPGYYNTGGGVQYYQQPYGYPMPYQSAMQTIPGSSTIIQPGVNGLPPTVTTVPMWSNAQLELTICTNMLRMDGRWITDGSHVFGMTFGGWKLFAILCTCTHLRSRLKNNLSTAVESMLAAWSDNHASCPMKAKAQDIGRWVSSILSTLIPHPSDILQSDMPWFTINPKRSATTCVWCSDWRNPTLLLTFKF